MDVFARSPYSDYLLALLRIVAGVVFISFGTMKLFGYPPGPMPPPPLMSQMGLAGILEVFGGLLIVQGLLTRPVAFVLAGEMAVAYFQAHAPQSIFPSVNNGGPAVLYCSSFSTCRLPAPAPGVLTASSLDRDDEPWARRPSGTLRTIDTRPSQVSGIRFQVQART